MSAADLMAVLLDGHLRPAYARPDAVGARDCGRLVTAEDHRPAGGLGDAVLEALTAADAADGVRVRKLAVRGIPTSGTPQELLHAAGIDTDAIVAATDLAGAPARSVGTEGRRPTWLHPEDRDQRATGRSLW